MTGCELRTLKTIATGARRPAWGFRPRAPRGVLSTLLFSLLAYWAAVVPVGAAAEKHIVLIAGPKSHAPGEHEYLKSIKLLKVLLDRAPNLKGVRTEIYFNGWPDDPKVLDRADTIAVLSDGEDNLVPQPSHAPFMTEERMKILEKQMKRGCGFITFHASTITTGRYAPQMREWTGGYFDVENGNGEGGFYGAKNDGPTRTWHSMIRDMEADVVPGAPGHAVLQGVAPFRFKDEFYYQLVFSNQGAGAAQILRVPALAPQSGNKPSRKF